MAFDVAADAYGRFMGRYAEPLAGRFIELLDPRPGDTALDVGCGPGALTARLVDRLGADAVAAVEPMGQFVDAVRRRLPGVDVRQGRAENLPFADATFDLAVAQLVVHFMADPVAGLGEMARVTKPGGTVAASVWDHAGGRGALSPFWAVAQHLHPGAMGEARGAGSRAGHLAELFRTAGLHVLDDTEISVTVVHDDFEGWWQPYTQGVGPAGDFLRSLTEDDRAELREACRRSLGKPPFEVTATAWTVVARG